MPRIVELEAKFELKSGMSAGNRMQRVAEVVKRWLASSRRGKTMS